MKHVLPLAVLLFWPALVWAEPGSSAKTPPDAGAASEEVVTGTIVVQVIQTSKGGTDVKGDLVTVELIGPDSTKAPRIMKAPVGPNGVAVIDKIPLSTPIHPKVSVTHGGRIFEAQARPGAEDDVMSVVDTERMFTITVHDTTEKPPPWEVTVWHVMIQPSPHGTVVSEILAIKNPSDQAWLGAPDAKGARSSVVLPLPAGATDVAMGGDLGLDRARVAGGRVISTAALPPGESQFSLRYILPAISASAVSR